MSQGADIFFSKQVGITTNVGITIVNLYAQSCREISSFFRKFQFMQLGIKNVLDLVLFFQNIQKVCHKEFDTAKFRYYLIYGYFRELADRNFILYG